MRLVKTFSFDHISSDLEYLQKKLEESVYIPSSMIGIPTHNSVVHETYKLPHSLQTLEKQMAAEFNNEVWKHMKKTLSPFTSDRYKETEETV